MSSGRRTLLSGNEGEERFGYGQGVAVGDLIHVSGQVGRDNPSGVLDGPTLLGPRLERSLRNVREVVTGLAGPDAALVHVQVHIDPDPDEHWAEIVPVLTRAFGDDRPALTIVPVPPSSPDYLVEVSAVATTSRTRTTVPDPGPIGTDLRTSRAVRIGDQVHLGGHLPLDASGAVIGEGFAGQLDVVCAALEATLREAGASIADVVSLHLWVAGEPTAEEFVDFCAVHTRVFGPGKPTATLLYVPTLPLGALVQISAVAIAASSGD